MSHPVLCVRRRTNRHPAIGLGLGGPVLHRVRIQPVRDLFCRRGDPPIAQPIQRADIGAQFGIQDPPILDRQAGRFPHDQGGAPFRERPALQRGQGVRHLMHQRLGQPLMPVPRAGESRRANPISLATPRPRRTAGTPAAASSARRSSSSAAAARA